MGYLAMIFGLGMVVSFAQSHFIGEVVLYSEKNFQGFSQAYPFVVMSCDGYGIGFPSPLNKSINSLKTDHRIAVQPMQACIGHVSVTLEAGSYPDLPSTLMEQNPLFQTVMKSIFMLPFPQDNVQLYSRGLRFRNSVLLLTVLVVDIGKSTPCFKFNDSMSTQIDEVNNHLNCLIFFTGKDCQGQSFKIDAHETRMSLEVYHPSLTYYGMKLYGDDNGRLGIKDVNGSNVSDRKTIVTSNSSSSGQRNPKFVFIFIVFLCKIF